MRTKKLNFKSRLCSINFNVASFSGKEFLHTLFSNDDGSSLTMLFCSGLVTVWLLLCLGPGLPVTQCPEYCSCMWRRGKEAVVCRDTRFSQIPASIAPNTQVRKD